MSCFLCNVELFMVQACQREPLLWIDRYCLHPSEVEVCELHVSLRACRRACSVGYSVPGGGDDADLHCGMPEIPEPRPQLNKLMRELAQSQNCDVLVRSLAGSRSLGENLLEPVAGTPFQQTTPHEICFRTASTCLAIAPCCIEGT